MKMQVLKTWTNDISLVTCIMLLSKETNSASECSHIIPFQLPQSKQADIVMPKEAQKQRNGYPIITSSHQVKRYTNRPKRIALLVEKSSGPHRKKEESLVTSPYMQRSEIRMDKK